MPPSTKPTVPPIESPAMVPVDKPSRKQPWKKHWPPRDGTPKETAYGFKEGTPVVIYGN